eukprot:Lankesteria_metandrocarpae@DN8735_c0_g1_i1.p1
MSEDVYASGSAGVVVHGASDDATAAAAVAADGGYMEDDDWVDIRSAGTAEEQQEEQQLLLRRQSPHRERGSANSSNRRDAAENANGSVVDAGSTATATTSVYVEEASWYRRHASAEAANSTLSLRFPYRSAMKRRRTPNLVSREQQLTESLAQVGFCCVLLRNLARDTGGATRSHNDDVAVPPLSLAAFQRDVTVGVQGNSNNN